MRLPIHQVDAFTGRLFGGNPAAVVLLPAWLERERMQAIAMENNLSETAFVVLPGEAAGGGSDAGDVDGHGLEAREAGLRWFTPTVEVDLCGHATLASAHVLFTHGYVAGPEIRFRYGGGVLTVRRESELFSMDFPSRPPRGIPLGGEEGRDSLPEVADALGQRPRELLESRDLLALFDTQGEVEGLDPDIGKVGRLKSFAVIASAPGEGCDFVSRFFAPKAGVAEDPVTGSAHCTLTPFWSERLGKKELHARQLSRRGGELFCAHRGERVEIRGRAVEYLRGTIDV